MQDLRFVWLELTGRCSLLCDHCYADSGPKGTDGAMLPEDWLRVIDEVTQLGGQMVQFIGGEPTLHRSLPALVDHALAGGLEVEVFSNLVHVSPQLWDAFAQPGVRLATSYYSNNATEHETITKGRNSYTRTKANIIEALRRSIPLRVGDYRRPGWAASRAGSCRIGSAWSHRNRSRLAAPSWAWGAGPAAECGAALWQCHVA
jgi:MoaA/NifB/PqqE/SkfB family radical SAM enzyme